MKNHQPPNLTIGQFIVRASTSTSRYSEHLYLRPDGIVLKLRHSLLTSGGWTLSLWQFTPIAPPDILYPHQPCGIYDTLNDARAVAESSVRHLATQNRMFVVGMFAHAPDRKECLQQEAIDAVVWHQSQQPDTTAGRAEEKATTSVLSLDSEELMRGDDVSIRVIFNNMSGIQPPEGEASQEQYLKMMRHALDCELTGLLEHRTPAGIHASSHLPASASQAPLTTQGV